MRVKTLFVTLLACNLGQTTLERFPELKEDVDRVLKEQSFLVEDLAWIAPCLGTAIRVSVESSTWVALRQLGHECERDCFFGSGSISAHLYYSWITVEGGRKVGHYDLLQPANAYNLFCVQLAADVTRRGMR